MARVTKGETAEVAIWLAFAVFAFALTFTFNQAMEVYKFGASGWPRAIIVLIVLAAFGQLYHDIKERLLGFESASIISSAGSETEKGYAIRIGAILVTPFVFAFLLEPIGFYVLAPFFVAAFLYIGGERRWRRILAISLFIHFVMVLCFAKLLYVGLPVGNVHPFYDFSNWLLVLIQ